MRRTQHEQIQSAMPHRADLNEACRYFADGPRSGSLATSAPLTATIIYIGCLDHEHGKTPISTLAAELGQRTLSPHMSPAWRQAFISAKKASDPGP
jgi:hypothetical protein